MGSTADSLRRAARTMRRAAIVAIAVLAPLPATALAGSGDPQARATDGAVQHPPQVVITAPAAPERYRLGEPVALRAQASDPDGPIAPEAIAWTVVRRTGAARLTVLETGGAQAAFTPSDRHGAGTTYEITATIADDHGLADTATLTIAPRTVKVTLASDPAGAPLALGDGSGTAPRVVEEAAGLRTTLTAPDETAGPGGPLVFDGWADGGERVREVVVPDTDVTWSARYRAPRIEIGEPAGPVTAAAATGIGDGTSGAGAYVLPTLTFDPPSLYAPRAIGGTLRDAPAGTRIQVAVRRGGAKAGCAWWNTGRRRFSRPSRRACAAPRWIRATVGRTGARLRWRAALGGALPAGSYAFHVRVLDAQGRPLDVARG